MCLQVQTDVRKYWYTQPTDLHFLKPEIHKCNRCGITNVPMHSNGTSSGTHKCTNALAEQWLPHHACPVDTVAGSTRIQTMCCHRLWEPAGFIFLRILTISSNFTSYSVYSLWSSMARLFPKFSFYLVIIPCLWIAAVKPDRGIKRA